MINLSKTPAVDTEEICLRGELSGAAETEVGAGPGGHRLGAEIIRLMPLKPADRAQLKAAQRIEVSLRYMMQNLNKPMKVPALSAMVGLSESSFFALFKSATGLTPLDFFIRARMQRAGELLAKTTLQIKEVAARLGYDDQFYFSRLFRSVYGIPPREYRARKEAAHNPELKPQSAREPFALAYLPANLPGHAPTAENQIREQVLLGGFQPAAPRPKAYPGNRPESSARPAPICSVSVQQ
jgi:AraC-like DNA-binding protein